MRLFTPAFHRMLHRDAYLVDTSRKVRPLVLEHAPDPAPVVAPLLERVHLMGKSFYAVRNRTFALFAAHRDGSFAVAPTEPFHDGVVAALQDALAAFGPVRRGEDAPADAFTPLLAYERGAVAFFETPDTRAWAPLAGRRGLRVLAATPTHAPDADVYVGDVPAATYVAEPDELTLDLDRLGDLPDDELNLLLDEQLKDWDKPS